MRKINIKIIIIIVFINIQGAKSESIDFDIDEMTGFPIVLTKTDSTFKLLTYYSSNSFTSSTVSGLSNPKSFVIFQNELIIIDDLEIKRYDKMTKNYLDTMKINDLYLPSLIYKYNNQLIIKDDSTNKFIKFNKMHPYNSSFFLDSILNSPNNIKFNSNLEKFIVLDFDSTNSIKIIDESSLNIDNTYNLINYESNDIIFDNYGTIIYTDNFSTMKNYIEESFTYTNEHFIPSYEIEKFEINQLDTNEIVILDKLSDTLIYLNYRDIQVSENLYPDSIDLISKYNIALNINSFNTNNINRFQLSDDISFSNIIVDTTVNEVFIEIDSIFSYGQTYYWKTKSSNIFNETTWSNTATFSIIELDSIKFINPITDTILVGNIVNIELDDSIGKYEIIYSYSSSFSDTLEINNLTNEYEVFDKTFRFDTTMYMKVRRTDIYTNGVWSETISVSSGSITNIQIQNPPNLSNNINESTTFNWNGNEHRNYRVEISTDSLFKNLIYSEIHNNNTLNGLDFTFKDTIYVRTRVEFEEQYGNWSDKKNYVCELNKPINIYPVGDVEMVSSLPLFEWIDTKEDYEFRIKNVNSSTYTDTIQVNNKLKMTGIFLEKDSTYQWEVRSISYNSGTIYSDWSSSTFQVSSINNTVYVPVSEDNEFAIANLEANIEDYNTKIVNYENGHFQLTERLFNQYGECKTNIEIDFNKSFTFTYYIYMGEEEYDENGGNQLTVFYIPEIEKGNVSSTFCSGINLPLIHAMIGIEFDTYNNFNTINNENNEPNIISNPWDVDHISVYVGTGGEPIAGNMTGDFYVKNRFVNAKKNTINIEDGTYHCVKNEWNSNTEVFSIFFDNEKRNEYSLNGELYKNGNKSIIIFSACTGNNAKNKMDFKVGEYVEE